MEGGEDNGVPHEDGHTESMIHQPSAPAHAHGAFAYALTGRSNVQRVTCIQLGTGRALPVVVAGNALQALLRFPLQSDIPIEYVEEVKVVLPVRNGSEVGRGHQRPNPCRALQDAVSIGLMIKQVG